MYSESILIKIGFDLKRRGFTRVPRTRSSTFRMPPYLFTDIVTCRIDNATASAEYYLLDDILILEQSLFDVRGWPQLIAIGMELGTVADWLGIKVLPYDFPEVLHVNGVDYQTHATMGWYNWCYAENISTMFLWNRIPELTPLEYKKLTQGDWHI